MEYLSLVRKGFNVSTGKAIAIYTSYISKSGKKTPYIGKFWSGCTSQLKRELEILGIDIVDMMLRADQTPDKLISITRYIVADAWFSKAGFVNEACLLGFHIISWLRDDANLWYSHVSVRTGKRGRPRIKGEKIDFNNPVLQHCKVFDLEA